VGRNNGQIALVLGVKGRSKAISLFPKTKAIGPLSRPTKSPLSLTQNASSRAPFAGGGKSD
jgi:hypothetical protein